MAGKTSKFMVGLFVTVAAIVAVVAIILVGATKYFEKGHQFVTYFDESVQGLQKDSTVKYRGVDVGRVEKIRVAPDNKLIGVIMKVNLKGDLPRTTVAQLKVAGITGLVFVELDRRKPDEPDQSPKLTFPSEYPVIPSRPSEVQKIMAGVNVVVEKFNQIDTRGVFDQLKSTAAEIEIFFRGKRMDSILAKIEASMANLQDITQRLDKMVAAGRLDEVLVEARDTLKGIKGEFSGMNIRDAVGQTRAIATEVKTTSENLRQASETLESFLTRINDRPSDLLFGKPPQKRWNE
jgi:phospholipid/cholesterol/gamma-HCH transport system substrate-binding protein